MRIYFIGAVFIAWSFISILVNVYKLYDVGYTLLNIVGIALNLTAVILWLLLIKKYYIRTYGIEKLHKGQASLYPSILIDYEKNVRLCYMIIVFNRIYIINYKKRS